MRIVSLVPSLTELLIDLGLGDELVGRTKFCIHPKEIVKNIPKIGGTKNVRISAVQELKPDLIIANKEENTKADVEILKQSSTVHVTKISNFSEALQSIREIGHLTNKESEAQALIKNINEQFSILEDYRKSKRPVFYLIWNDPLMTIGRDTFIHDMLNMCGFENIFGDQNRYPTPNVEEIRARKPAYIFLSSEPFPFKEKHIQEFKAMFPKAKVVLVDGEYFSWYGSRMVLAADYFINFAKELN